ncbi:hypothetical protein [Vampirovibrio chlorellavorus]|uniref:hypothetical protein n=1 Tax=Vampirovibrio chlorellavorus TaxID=758823 RepID=UPI0026ED88FA|nr:hypothetical protein [Vampirovibrio chlorellavorus]
MAMQLNPWAQRALAQSVNLGYAGRGAYRVHETNPERKGDYWFRDFGMVMACTYMTEMGFRGTERFYTMPLLTNALELHALNTKLGQKRVIPTFDTVEIRNETAPARNGVAAARTETAQLLNSTALYPRAWNYAELPEALREKMMGTLIRNSAELVPQVLQEEALNEIKALQDKNSPLYDTLRQLITHPLNPENGSQVEAFIAETAKLGNHRADLERIAKIDNKALAKAETQTLFQKLSAGHPDKQTLKTHIHQSVQLLKTEQLGILINHLDRNLNFQHYLESNFLKPKAEVLKPKGLIEPRNFQLPEALAPKNPFSAVDEMSDIVSDRMRFYINKLHGLQHKGKADLRNLAEKVRRLPLDQREKAFTKGIQEIENLQFLYKKESLTDFWHASTNQDILKRMQEEGLDHNAIQDRIKRDNLTLQTILQGIHKSKKQQGNQDQKLKFQEEWAKENEKVWRNWEDEFRNEKGRLQAFLTNPGERPHKPRGYISMNQLNKKLGHFESWFETISKSLQIKNMMLDSLWQHLGADLLLQVKKKVKTAFEDVNKLPYEHLPRYTDGPLKGQPVEKWKLLEARLQDMGLRHWLDDGEIRHLSQDLGQHLPKMSSATGAVKDLEQHSVESVMGKVKKTIWAHLTGDMDYSHLNDSFCPNLKAQLDSKLAALSPEEQLALKAGKIRGKLFRQLTNTDAFGNPLANPKEEGLETLLKKVLNEKNLHTIENQLGQKVKSAEWTIKSLITDGLQSHMVKSAVNKIQRNGTWPKILTTVGLNFIFYGWLASRFDNKVLQPYQEKLVAQKGTAQDIVNAGYLGTLPALAVLSQAWDKTTLPFLKGLRHMNHFSRFATVGGVALGVFAGSSYGLLKVLEKKSAPQPGYPKKPAPAPAGPKPSPALQPTFNALSKPASSAVPAFTPVSPFSTQAPPKSFPFQPYRPQPPGFTPPAALNRPNPGSHIPYPQGVKAQPTP